MNKSEPDESEKPSQIDSLFRKLLNGFGFVFLIIILNILNTKTERVVNWLLFAVATVATLFIARRIGLNASDLGTEKRRVRSGLIYGCISAAAVIVAFGLMFLANPDFFADSRYDKTASAIFYTIAVYIPLHTVLAEELLFRGVLLGFLLKHTSQRRAIVGSSLLFGFWHILPSLGLAKSSQTISGVLGSDYTSQVTSVTGAVLVTALAGVAFSWLRIRSKSLVAPMIAHWAINSAGVLFAFIAF